MTETARELLWRHNLPEDVIDGALALHAQELAAAIREETDRLKFHGVLEPHKYRPCRDAANQIDPTIDEHDPAASAVVPAADRAAQVLTAEEARALAEDLGYQLYRAQDALAFVGECCDIADREQRPVTTADVREWLKGARCGRQLLAESAAVDQVAAETPPAETDAFTPRCDHCRQPGHSFEDCPRADHGPAVEAQPGKDTEEQR